MLDVSGNNHVSGSHIQNNFSTLMSHVNRIDTNINTLKTTDTNLATQIQQFNAQITALNNSVRTLNEISIANKAQILSNIDKMNVIKQEFNQHIDTLNNNVVENNQKLNSLKTDMNTLSKKLGKLFSFVPNFVSATSQYFVRLLFHVKNNSLNELENVQYDTKLLENTENIV